MLAEVERVLAFRAPGREFFRHIRTFLRVDDLEYTRIKKAYRLARKECKDRRREDGSTAFGHGLSVCLFGMIILGIKEPARIIAMLLHDVVEDLNGWTHERVERRFGPDVVYYTRWLSKPHPKEFSTKHDRDEFYCQTFLHAPVDVLELKLPDVLHNLRTLFACPIAKQQRIVGVARRVYLPLALTHHILACEITTAIERVEKGWAEEESHAMCSKCHSPQ